MLHRGTLQDLLESDDGRTCRGLNILDLPMGGAPIPMPPQYRFVDQSLHVYTVFAPHLCPVQAPGFE